MKNRLYIFVMMASLSGSILAQNPIGVSEFQEKVLDYSQTLKQSVTRQTAMQKSMKLAKTAFFPAVDASGSFQYRINDYDMEFGGASIPMEKSSYSAEIGIVQPIYAGGAISNTYQATKIQHKIAEKSVELTKDNIIYAAQVSYWGTVAQKDMYARMCDYVEIIEKLTKKLEDKYELGQISKTDLIQMQTRLKEAQLQKSSSLQQYKLAIENMNVLMGESPSNELAVADTIGATYDIIQQVDVNDALSLRPDFSISQLEVDYQKKQVSLAESKYNPTISVGLNGTWGTQMLNIDGSTMFNSNLFASVKLPIFHWGARYKSKASQKALLLGKQYAMQDKRDQITKEVANAMTTYTESKNQIELAKENCKLAEENLDLNTFSYDEGKLTIIDVLSAQLTWIQANTNLIQSEYKYKVAVSDYEKSVGSRYLSMK